MSLRQLPAPARSPAACTAPVASTAEAAWQALCTHPADAPLVHVDHSHRFHTPADTDGLFGSGKKKVQAPKPAASTPTEVAFIGLVIDFVRSPAENEEKMEVNILNMSAHKPYTQAFKAALRDELKAKDEGKVEYSKSQLALFTRMRNML